MIGVVEHVYVVEWPSGEACQRKIRKTSTSHQNRATDWPGRSNAILGLARCPRRLDHKCRDDDWLYPPLH